MYPSVQLSASSVLVVHVMSPVTLVLGTVGNVMILAILSRSEPRNRAFYIFLSCLAVCDLLQLYVTLLPTWLAAGFGLRAYKDEASGCYFLQWMYFNTATISPWLLSALATLRTLAVIRPFHVKVWCTTSMAVRVVIKIVVLTAIFHSKILYLDPECAGSAMDWGHQGAMSWVNNLVRFMLPMLILAVMNTVLARKIWVRFRRPVRVTSLSVLTSTARMRNVSSLTAMPLLASATFFLLASPKLIMETRIALQGGRAADDWQENLLRALAFQLWYVNTAATFLLYCLTGRKFRAEFRRILNCKPPVMRGGLTPFEISPVTISYPSRVSRVAISSCRTIESNVTPPSLRFLAHRVGRVSSTNSGTYVSRAVIRDRISENHRESDIVKLNEH